jgi:hypothetical protein
MNRSQRFGLVAILGAIGELIGMTAHDWRQLFCKDAIESRVRFLLWVFGYSSRTNDQRVRSARLAPAHPPLARPEAVRLARRAAAAPQIPTVGNFRRAGAEQGPGPLAVMGAEPETETMNWRRGLTRLGVAAAVI